jgi:hypothetical protein
MPGRQRDEHLLIEDRNNEETVDLARRRADKGGIHPTGTQAVDQL